MTTFKRASKSASRLRLALAGPAGSGKTYTALAIATHLAQGGPVAVVDTERGSASKYSDLYEFDVLEMQSFHPERYIEAIGDAEAAGYTVLVIDSLSHAWMGKDGALELVDRAQKRNNSGNSFAAWRDVTPLHNQLVDAMLASNLHLIVTLRSKQDYVQEKDDRGRTVIRKVGMAPVQRDGLEYEFDVYGDLRDDNTLIVGKTRLPALAGAVIPKPGKQLADQLAEWLTGEPVGNGATVPAAPSPTTNGVSAASTPAPASSSPSPVSIKRAVGRDELLSRWGNLLSQAQGLGLTVKPLADDATAEQITERGKELKAQIDAAPVPA